MEIKKVFLSLFFIIVIIFFLPSHTMVYGQVFHYPCTSVETYCDCSSYDSLCNWGDVQLGAPPIYGTWCTWGGCYCIGCDPESYDCCPCSSCGGGGCFTGETEIGVKNSKTQELQTEKIENLKPGDVVESFDPETREITEGTVEDVTKTTREGYYILETESGEKVKVTGEHPFLAIKSENNQAPSTKFQTTLDKFKDILSQTLTYKLITGLQAKIAGILP